MTDLTDLPEWVWNLLDALDAYEDEDAPLYRLSDVMDDGRDVYERTGCFGAFLTERKAWPPREVSDAAEFRRHVIATSPSPTPNADESGARA